MTDTNTPRGPFDTPAQAFAASGGLHLAIQRADPGGAMDDAIRAARRAAKVAYVIDVLTSAGVELGQHDEHIARWLTTWDPETVIVLLDWVLRARSAAAGDVRTWRVEASLNLPPTPEEIDALRASGLANLTVESKAFDVRLHSTVCAATKADATALVRDLVATVPGLRVVLVDDAFAPETTGLSWVLYRPRPGSDVLEPAGVDGDQSGPVDPLDLARQTLTEFAPNAPGWVVKVFGPGEQLVAWAAWVDAVAVACAAQDGGAR